MRHGGGHALRARFGHGSVELGDGVGEVSDVSRLCHRGHSHARHRAGGRHGSARRALAGRLHAKVLDRRGQPVLEVGVEAVLRLSRLQVEKAQHERSGQAEQGGREGDAHAAERRGEAGLHRVEHRGRFRPYFQRSDHPADRAHRFQEAPEGAEQAEEDQQAREVAQQVARFVEAGADRFQDAAHRRLGDRHASHAVAEQRRHRRQKDGGARDFEAGIGDTEAVHPRHLGQQAHHLPEGEDDADEQHAEDDAVQPGIVEEGPPDRLVEDGGQRHAEQHEDEHPHQEDAGRRKLMKRIRRVHAGGRPTGGGNRRRKPSGQNRLSRRTMPQPDGNGTRDGLPACPYLRTGYALRSSPSRSRRTVSLPTMMSPLASILSLSSRSDT